MEKLQLALDLIVAILGIIPTVVAGIALIRTIIKNKNWAAIANIAQDAMSAVEQIATTSDMSGEEKLNLALELIKKNCTANGITIDDSLTSQITAYIAELCKWSKTINVIKK